MARDAGAARQWLETQALRAAGDGRPDWNAKFDAMLR
jgi:hypothetical protein